MNRREFLASTAALAVVPSVARAQGLANINIRLDWLPSGYHAPLFLGVKRGYFKDVGYNVTIADGAGDSSTIQALLSGNSQVAFMTYSSLIQSAGKGMPLVGIGGLVQRMPNAVISLADRPIEKPEDLYGKSIVLAPGSSSAQIYPAFVAAAKLNESKIKIVNASVSTVITVLLNNQADAMIGWSFTDAVRVGLQKPIAPLLQIADYGVNFMSVGFVTTQSTLTSKPDMLKKITGAMTRSYQDGLKEQDAAVDAIMEARPMADRKLMVRQLAGLDPFLQTARSKGKPFGWVAKEDVEETYALLRKYFGMTETLDVDKVFTNAYMT